MMTKEFCNYTTLKVSKMSRFYASEKCFSLLFKVIVMLCVSVVDWSGKIDFFEMGVQIDIGS